MFAKLDHLRRWKEVRHDRTVTWLAYWKDPIDTKGYKYVFLGANSTFKTESDLAKYEKARQLKDHIARIRADYEKLWRSKDAKERQMSVALYFIDVLALRAGHEKDEDEAETVGCCTLKARRPSGAVDHGCSWRCARASALMLFHGTQWGGHVSTVKGGHMETLCKGLIRDAGSSCAALAGSPC
jgi:Eukaryotic DNA topoisomerase I, catalytic core/Eukaryotic DNA topoisomerase I, DNA binding fragment